MVSDSIHLVDLATCTGSYDRTSKYTTAATVSNASVTALGKSDMMADEPKAQSVAIRFNLPHTLQKFDLFWKLPYDIRHMIWEEVIFTPGIHFLKFIETLDAPIIRAQASAGTISGGSLTALPERRAEGTPETDSLVYSATLKPIFPLSCADNSHYITLNQTLDRLRASCDEVKHLVDQVLGQPDNVTLDNGQLVMLQRSSDVVCIDYPNMTHARNLGRWAEHLNLDQLAKVRRLAVRYHHEWDNDLVCGYCGRAHSYHGKHPYPRHVYEFAALFRNLETFYFIDYLTVRKPPRPHCTNQAQDFGGPHERFASGDCGRTYFEVDPKSCTTHTHVYETLSWLQSNYIAHCMCKSLGPSHPEKVRFKILACGWDSEQKLVPTKCLGVPRTTQVRKTRTRSRPSNLAALSQKSLPMSGGSLFHTPESSPLPVVFGDAGKSKFDFDLEIPYKMKAPCKLPAILLGAFQADP